MTPKENLERLQLKLPTVSIPGGNYVSVNTRDKIAYVAIQFPMRDEKYYYQGKLGRELSSKDGYMAMQLAALNVLAQIDNKMGFDGVLGLNHIDAYYQAVDGWDDAPKVVDGASDLFEQILEGRGRHSRSILGVEQLPREFSVGLTCSFTLL